MTTTVSGLPWRFAAFGSALALMAMSPGAGGPWSDGAALAVEQGPGGAQFVVIVEDGSTSVLNEAGAVDIANCDATGLELSTPGYSVEVGQLSDGGCLPPTEPAPAPPELLEKVRTMDRFILAQCNAPVIDPDRVPRDIIQGALRATPEWREVLLDYVRGDGTSLPAMTGRGQAVVRALERSEFGSDEQTMADISQAIVEITSDLMTAPRIFRVFVDSQYVPPPGAFAWDLGPEGSALSPGFQPLVPGDTSITGDNLEGVTIKDAGHPLVADGIKGVVSVQKTVENGIWRIILLTTDYGNPETRFSPFGTELIVNGQTFPLGEQDPQAWLGPTFLTTTPEVVTGELDMPAGSGAPPGAQVAMLQTAQGVGAAAGAPAGGLGGYRDNARVGGFSTDIQVSDGKILFTFIEPAGRSSFISGIVLEPATVQVSLQLPCVPEAAIAPGAGEEEQIDGNPPEGPPPPPNPASDT